MKLQTLLYVAPALALGLGDDVVPEPFLWSGRPDLIDPALDCAARRVAHDFTVAVLPRAAPGVYEALQMKRYCNITETTIPIPTRLDDPNIDAAGCPTDSPTTWFVDGSLGSDDNDGSFASPFQSLHHAVATSRSTTSSDKTIVLRDGTHFLLPLGTLILSVEDSHLTITSCDNERAHISGGVLISDDWASWAPWSTNDNISIIRNATNGLYTIDQLFVNNGRSIRARHPNSNPERDQWPSADIPSNTTFPHAECDFTNAPYPNNIFGTKDCQYNATMYIAPQHVDYPDTPWMLPPVWQQSNPTHVFVEDPNYNGTAFGLPEGVQFVSEGGMSPMYEAFYGGPMDRFADGWNVGPTRTSLNNITTPGGVFYDATTFAELETPPTKWANPSTGIVHVVHALGLPKAVPWFNWMFELEEIIVDKEGNEGIVFGKGGWQSTQGDEKGSHFFIENVLELLDSENEFFHDVESDTLYLWRNHTDTDTDTDDNDDNAADNTDDNDDNADVVGAVLESVIHVDGGEDITIKGVTIAHTTTDYMLPHVVPGGGDQTVHRDGAIRVENGVNVVIDDCTFDRVGGNGVFVSGKNEGVVIQNSEFSFVGGGAIMVVGEADKNTGSTLEGNFPRRTSVLNNWIHDGGVYKKDYGGGSIFLALQSESIIEENVIYNTPRSCLCFNDNMGGGDVVRRNVLANCNRETGDTGTVYTYNRVPFLNNVRTGSDDDVGTLIPLVREIGPQNVFFANYGSGSAIDNDDGSSYYDNHHNVAIFKGVKHSTFPNGAHRKSNRDSLYVVSSNGGHAGCELGGGYYEFFVNNTCFLMDPGAIPWSCDIGCTCDPDHPVSAKDEYDYEHQYATPTREKNTYYIDEKLPEFPVTCGGENWTLAEAQAKGVEVESEVSLSPIDVDVLWEKMARELLGL